MKKVLLVAACMTSLLLVGNAFAIPFTIGNGGSIAVSPDGGLGLYNATAIASGPYELSEGEMSPLIDFFSVSFLAASWGDVTATIDLLTPSATGPVQDMGTYIAIGAFDANIQAGYVKVNWNDPVDFDYSYGTLTGGKFRLDLLDINYFGFDCDGPLWQEERG